MNTKQQLGKFGEDLAARYYEENGYTLIARNARTKHGEIDIVCSKKNCLYSIEVKTRRGIAYGYPEEAITPKKHERMLECAWEYANKNAHIYDVIIIQVCAIIVDYQQVTI